MKLKGGNKYIQWGVTAFCVVLSSIVFLVILTNFSGFYHVVRGVMAVLSPLLYGVVFVFLLDPLVKTSERFLIPWLLKKSTKPESTRKLCRLLSILFALIVMGLFIYGMFAMVLPQLYDTIKTIIKNLPDYYYNIEKWILNILDDNPDIKEYVNSLLEQIYTYVEKFLSVDLLNNIQTVMIGLTTSVMAVVREVLSILIGLVASVYLLWSKERYCAQVKKLTVAIWKAKTADRIFEISRKANKIFSGFIIAKLIDSLIVGVLCYIGMLILRLPFPVLISTIIAVTNVIPYFGPIIGTAPCALLILFVNPLQSFYFVIFVLVLQQIDGNVIAPRILGDSIGISSFWVLISITLFGSLFGLMGMMLGVPIFAVLYVMVSNWVTSALQKKGRTTVTDDYYVIQNVKDLPPAPMRDQTVGQIEMTDYAKKIVGGE